MPEQPGVYIFKNGEGKPIYVGKSSSLKHRLLSYFRNFKPNEMKRKAMMSKVYDVEIIPLGSEQEALIKENELIKLWQPRYNIMLRDDKTYPWIKVSILDPFPRIELTRSVAQDGSLYYGPYPKVGDVKKVLDYVIETYRIRDCQQRIVEGIPSPECLSLQISRCDGPCVDKISVKDYRELIKKALNFLDGQQKDIIRNLKKEMDKAASLLKFEQASEKRDMILMAKSFQQGTFLKKRYFYKDTLKKLQEALGLKKLPSHVECFDISHISGSWTVASMVVFKKGQPSKKDYRIFKIKTVKGIDDFASMAEVIERRYSSNQKKDISLPDLIVIDGGIGQLNVSKKVLKEIGISLDIISLAKRFEMIYVEEEVDPVILSKYSDELCFLQRVRDEAHRFAIKAHRKWRDKKVLESPLRNILGVGPVLEERLLKRFKTTKNMSHQSIETLADVSGVSRQLAKKIIREISNEATRS